VVSTFGLETNGDAGKPTKANSPPKILWPSSMATPPPSEESTAGSGANLAARVAEASVVVKERRGSNENWSKTRIHATSNVGLGVDDENAALYLQGRYSGLHSEMSSRRHVTNIYARAALFTITVRTSSPQSVRSGSQAKKTSSVWRQVPPRGCRGEPLRSWRRRRAVFFFVGFFFFLIKTMGGVSQREMRDLNHGPGAEGTGSRITASRDLHHRRNALPNLTFRRRRALVSRRSLYRLGSAEVFHFKTIWEESGWRPGDAHGWIPTWQCLRRRVNFIYPQVDMMTRTAPGAAVNLSTPIEASRAVLNITLEVSRKTIGDSRTACCNRYAPDCFVSAGDGLNRPRSEIASREATISSC